MENKNQDCFYLIWLPYENQFNDQGKTGNIAFDTLPFIIFNTLKNDTKK